MEHFHRDWHAIEYDDEPHFTLIHRVLFAGFVLIVIAVYLYVSTLQYNGVI